MSDRRESLILTDYALKRPSLVLALLVIFCLFGAYSYLKLGVDLFPRVRFPLVNVTFTDPGESPEGITEKIVLPVENALSVIPGIKHVHSTVVPGAAVFTAVFSDETLSGNPEILVKREIERLSGVLPTGIPAPKVTRENPTRLPLLWIIIPLDKADPSVPGGSQTWRFVFQELLPRMERIKGIRSVQVLSSPPQVVHVYLSSKAIASEGISTSSLASQLKERSREYPAGSLTSEENSLNIDVKGNPISFDQISSFPVLLESGKVVPLSRISKISLGTAKSDSIFRFEGMPAIALKLYPTSGTNLIRLSSRVRNLLSDIRKGIGVSQAVPPTFRPTIRMDRSIPVDQNNRELLETLVLGAILAVLVILLFLGNFRETAVAALAIPASVLLTFPFLSLFHFTLNNLTMLGLSLVVGILIDDAIVVLENIHRHKSLGELPIPAARFGVGEIGRAVLATTFSIVAVFAPMAMMHGVLGEFFKEFGWTVSFAVLASLLISLTVSPSLTILGTKERIQESRHLFPLFSYWGRILSNLYGAWLRKAMQYPLYVLMGSLVLLGASIFVGSRLGWNLIPEEDQGAFTVHLRLSGSPSLARTDRVAAEISGKIMKLKGVRSVFQQVGGENGNPPSEGYLYVNLLDRLNRADTDKAIMERTRTILSSYPNVRTSVDAISPLGGTGASAPFQCFLMGGKPEVLARLSENLQVYLKKISGVRDVNSSRAGSLDIVMIRPKLTNPPEWGITSGRLAQWISQVSATHSAGKVETKDGDVEVMVSMNPADAATLSDISNLPFPVGPGRSLPLSSLATVDQEESDQRMSRDDRMPAITVTANIHGTVSLGEVMQKVDMWAKNNLTLPYHIRYAGNSDVLNDAKSQIVMAIIVAVFVVYGLLSFQFGSLILPFVIMLSMPFSLVGAILALWISRISVNMMGAIGLIILFGLVTKNAILLVDYANTLGRRGRSIREAALESAIVRLRPIAMTTLAMVFGMAPMAVGWGAGGEIRQSMAVVVIGGLLSSMFFTLFLVPVVYEWLSLLKKSVVQERVKGISE